MPFSEENEEKVRENSNKAMPFRKKKKEKKERKIVSLFRGFTISLLTSVCDIILASHRNGKFINLIFIVFPHELRDLPTTTY